MQRRINSLQDPLSRPSLHVSADMDLYTVLQETVDGPAPLPRASYGTRNGPRLESEGRAIPSKARLE